MSTADNNLQNIKNAYSKGYGAYSKPVLKKLGAEVAILLDALIFTYTNNLEKNTVITDSYFLCTREYIENGLNFSYKKQIRLLKTLKENGLIDVKMLGMPSKRFIKINGEALAKFVTKDVPVAFKREF